MKCSDKEFKQRCELQLVIATSPLEEDTKVELIIEQSKVWKEMDERKYT